MTSFVTFPSPVGDLLLVALQGALQRIVFLDARAAPPEPDWVEDPEALAPVVVQLEEYFRGERREFDLALEPVGTEFQRAVWSLVSEIPFGRTATYGDIARRLGRPAATRAVGAANGKNPLPIVIPCHRVIGQDGSLIGFGGGMSNKRWLLEHEGAVSAAQMALPFAPQ